MTIEEALEAVTDNNGELRCPSCEQTSVEPYMYYHRCTNTDCDVLTIHFTD